MSEYKVRVKVNPSGEHFYNHLNGHLQPAF